MSISSISNLSGFSAGSDNNATKAKSAASTSAPTGSPASSTPSSSTIVTLSNGRSSTVAGSSETLTGIPLAVAWAPQTFVQADANGDNQVNSDEFANLMKRAGVAAESAQKLFQSFDTSHDGNLSIDEFVQGVSSDIASGSTEFDKVLGSLTSGTGGTFNEQAMQSFLSAGSDVAAKYWAVQR